MSGRSSSNDLSLARAIGEMTQAARQMQVSLEHMNQNLRTLNDSNILHQEQAAQEHKTIITMLQDMTKKYWWLIIVLIGAVFVVLGYKEIVKLLLT